jgi:hypothetical protein
MASDDPADHALGRVVAERRAGIAQALRDGLELSRQIVVPELLHDTLYA